MSRKYEVTDDDTAVGDAVVVGFETDADLSDHFVYGGRGHFGVIGCVAVGFGECGIHIFEIRQVDVDESFERTQRFDAFVSAAVIDYSGRSIRRGASGVNCFEQRGDEVCTVRCCHQSQKGCDGRKLGNNTVGKAFYAFRILCVAVHPSADLPVLSVYAL